MISRLMSDPARPLFRKEAVDELNRAANRPSLLRTTPTWTRWTYFVVVGACAAAIAYSAIGTIDEYAMGPALIRAEGRREVTASAAGTVALVDVRPGERVDAGRLLLRLHDASEAAEYDRLEHEFDQQLVKSLRDPGDQAARQALTSLRAQKELAQARLDERSVRAPQDGIVSDVRIRPGQHLNPGDVILTLVPPDAAFTVIAMLPGSYRPMLHAGMPLRMELDGYRYQYRRLAIDEISDEVVGPAEVKRYLGPEIADAVSLTGPVVLVQASLPTSTFDLDGRAVRYHDGMMAKAEARVRSERILVSLVPGLRALVQR